VNGHLSVEVLQSQLFIMKALSFAMAARWASHKEEVMSSAHSAKGSSGLSPSSESPPSGKGPSTSAPPWIEPSALDDNCARYILSVMVLYLRQTAPPETRLMSSAIISLDSSFYDFESTDVPTYAPALEVYCHEEVKVSTPHSTEPTLHSKSSTNTVNSGATEDSIPVPMMPLSFHYDRTHMSLVRSSFSLNTHIGKYAGRIIYHLSASNWMAVFDRIRTKVHILSSTSEDNPDTVDLQVMSHSAMDRGRLVQVLQGTQSCADSSCN
jgi:hypothetical protein